MDAQGPDSKLEESVSEQIAQSPTQDGAHSDQHFEQVVRDALEGVGGILLFKMRFDRDEGTDHVAAAAIGEGDERRFLLLTLPAGASQLKVETAAKSTNPLAKIAASYAGLADAFAAAA